jgi:hypothetical protein
MPIAPGEKLRTLAQLRLSPRLERILNSTFGMRAQRLGAQALRRAAARFPVLAELVGLRREVQLQVAVSTCLGSTRLGSAVDAELTPAPVQELLDRLLRDASWQVRAGAAAELAQRDDEEALEGLLAALHDPSAEVAAAAIDSLSRKSDGRIAPALERVLDNREGYYSPVTRASAVLGLGRALKSQGLRMLSKALTDVDAEVSLAAIAAIAEHTPEHAAEHIVPLLEDRSGYYLPFVRLSAVHGLTRVGALSHHDAVRLRRHEQDDSVRAALERVMLGTFRA